MSWSTSEEERSEICRAISAIEGSRVLEIGAFKGETTRVLAEAACERGGYVAVIDPMRWSDEVVTHWPGSLTRLGGALLGDASYEADFWQNVGALRSHVRLHRSTSCSPELTDHVPPDLAELDVIFVDGDPSYEGVGGDLWHWGRRTAPGGTIFVHHATPAFPGVMQALEEFGRAHDLRVEHSVTGSLAVMRVEASLLSAPRKVA